jgi:hypothetical protein
LGYYVHLLIRYLWLLLRSSSSRWAAAFSRSEAQAVCFTGVLQVEAQEQKVLPSDDIQPLGRKRRLHHDDRCDLTSDSLLVRVAKARDFWTIRRSSHPSQMESHIPTPKLPRMEGRIGGRRKLTAS